MKHFIPTEEEFETLLSALDSYMKEKVTGFIVSQNLKRMEGLTDEKAFMDAFSKKPDAIDQAELATKTKEVRDSVLLLAAKLVEMRKHYRDASVIGAIEALTQ